MNLSGPGMAGPTPPAGIEAYVPIRRLPSGNAMLLSPGRAELAGPPNVNGMPVMPPFPPGMLNGQMPPPGTGQPTAPVAPFNPVPLSAQMAERYQIYPGPPSIAGLVPPVPPGPRAV